MRVFISLLLLQSTPGLWLLRAGLAFLFSDIVLLVQDLLAFTTDVVDGLLRQSRPRTFCSDKVQLG